MITNLPQDFINEIQSKSRKPIQLIEFELPDETFYLSDVTVGKGQGLANDYQPWVESWGTLKDNTVISNIFEGNSLEIRSATISIVVSPVSKTFVKQLFAVGVENTVVKLYQWFSGIASTPVLIDVMVCQDPIRHSEASMLLSIDIVSTLMKTDPFLWVQEADLQEQSIVVGKATGMPLKDLQTSRVTALAQDMTFDGLGTFFIDNGVGFAASGVVSIDSEDMTYDWISASGINITARAQNGTTARPHLRGALVSPYGAIYDYAICSGPVQLVDNLLANGEPYANDVELFPGQNPVLARFHGRPPWLKVSPGAGGDDIIPDPVTSTEYGNTTEQHYGNTASEPTGDSSINSPSGSASLVISQQTGGGAGSYDTGTRSTPSSYYNIANFPSVSQLVGNGQLPYGFGTYDGNYSPTDGISGWEQVTYPTTHTNLGNLTGITASVKIRNCFVKNAEAKVEIFFIDSGGTAHSLDSDQKSATGAFSTNLKFNGTLTTYNVSAYVSTFAQLALCSIRVVYTNIQSFANGVFEGGEVNYASVRWVVSYFIPSGTVPSPYQELASKFNRDLSSLGAITNVNVKVLFSATVSNATVNVAVIKRSTSDRANDTNLWSSTISSNLSGVEKSFSLGSMSWSTLLNTRIGVFHQITGPNTEDITRSSSVSFSYVKWEITYQPGAIPTPDEERVVYAETLVCDVTSNLGADPTPAQVVRHMIEAHSDSGAYIDTTDFDTAHTNYDNISYYLNGVLDAGIRLHAALKQVLREGMCRLLFNQGKIKLITYFEATDLEVDFEVNTDDIQLRSRKTDNQPTSGIRNDITVLYDKNYVDGVFSLKETAVDDESVALFFRKEYKRELSLINSQPIATLQANRLIALLSRPNSVYSFNMFMNAYELEKGDRVSAIQFIDPRFTVTGNILSVERTFGKGKQKQINLFNIKISNPVVTAHLELEDIVAVDDSSFTQLKGLILTETVILDDTDNVFLKNFNISTDRIVIEDTLYLNTCGAGGYGFCGYGILPYGD